MLFNKTLTKTTPLFALLLILFFSCMKYAKKTTIIRETPAEAAKNAKTIQAKTSLKIAKGLQLSLWASDTLAPDPVAISVDTKGRVYLTRTNRQKNSEFDIRGHRDWMTPSISLQSVEERRDFLHKTFAPERSKENEWLKDLNYDDIHDWHDLTIEKDEIWRLEDTNKDGLADISTQIFKDLNEEITDVAGGILVREKDVFLAIAPDLWRLEDTNNDGILDKKTSISHGYAVHIGFSGHGMSGIVEGPDGRIYWNIGDIGANITSVEGKKFENPNSGLIARCNPDGTDFELFATGLRNTHEFAFDEYGNLISSDNDGDHPGESERLVHIVEGSDAGWRSNWQYGKYTDPKNNDYKVWMDEKLYIPRWTGQAAYIIPPIINYHNGPTGMVYNPGTALGSAWKNKFFLVEFVGTPSGSHIWSFGLKPKGASFELDGETDVVSGILPTGIQFGPDGALYVADWVNGWGTKDYGRVWKLDVTPETNDLATIRLETQRLMQLNYAKQSPETLYSLLFNADMRIRQKAQFELVNRGKIGFPFLNKAINQTENQLARVHGIWGIGQLARKDKTNAAALIPLLKDRDAEIVTQTIKILGDAEIQNIGNELITLLKNQNYRVRFYAAEALGQLKHAPAVEPLIAFLANNNDEDVYLRHAAVLALSRIGKVEPIVALAKNPNKALRTAAVLVLRRLQNEQIAVFLKDADEYIATEAARAINDDLSIPNALPALAATLKETRFTAEPLLRRAINAALRVGGEKELTTLIDFAKRNDITDVLKIEALATLGTWANPSVLDRVDGRLRGKNDHDLATIQGKIKPFIPAFLKETKPSALIGVASVLSNLNISDFNTQLATIYTETKEIDVKTAILSALNQLNYAQIETIIKNGMEDDNEKVRTTALGLLSDRNISKESLPVMVKAIFEKGGTKEQQQLLVVMGKLQLSKTEAIFNDFIAQKEKGTFAEALSLEFKEAIDATGSTTLKAKLAAIKPPSSLLDQFAEALFGGNQDAGHDLFFYNSTAQCIRCHAINGYGGNVGPDLGNIGKTLTKPQLLQALIEPSTRIAPGFGSVALKLNDGQDITGILMKETSTELTIKTTDAEPLIVPIARIKKRDNFPSSMPAMNTSLSKRELRDIVAFLGELK
ncbi:MAG: hypothetical protein RLZZ292_370 [Bacteroidota bacterium]|jgi:putative membrane-bound dehydrogenase-like protein